MNHKQKTAKKQMRSRRILLLLIAVLLASATVVIFALANIPKDVTILDGKTSLKITTNERNPQKIIETNGFQLGKYDVLDTSQFDMENSVLIIKREMTVVFGENGGESWRVTLPARTVNDVLEYLNVSLEENDAVEPAGFEIVEQGSRITLYKAGEATLRVDGNSMKVVTSNKTVRELLSDNHIVLGKFDLVEPAEDTVVSSGECITVTRVTFKEITKKEKIDYKTVESKDSTMAAGTRKTISEGKAGEAEISYRVRYENGKAVAKKALSKKVLREPVDKVVKVGTAQQANAKVSSSGDEKGFKYKAKYTGIASAYYEPAGNLTASGMTVGVGRIGVNPNVIPYGTKLYVTGYGYCVAADCGWGTTGMGRLADLYFPSEAECEAWGIREVTIYVLA